VLIEAAEDAVLLGIGAMMTPMHDDSDVPKGRGQSDGRTARPQRDEQL
jgi:hypothetical protein